MQKEYPSSVFVGGGGMSFSLDLPSALIVHRPSFVPFVYRRFDKMVPLFVKTIKETEGVHKQRSVSKMVPFEQL